MSSPSLALAESRLRGGRPPLVIWNNDGDDLKWTGYGHHRLWTAEAESTWPRLRPLTSTQDYLDLRMSPLAASPVDCVSLCGNFGVPVWQFPPEHITVLGEDPLQPVIELCRANSTAFLFSVRMNDWHHSLPNHNWAHLWDAFRPAHYRLFLGAIAPSDWEAVYLPWIRGQTQTHPQERLPEAADRYRRLYDYEQEEVRDHYLATVAEACRRYDLDGLELDWLRCPMYFRAERIDMRFPDSPEKTHAIGLDAESWIADGLVDLVIAGHGLTFGVNPVGEWVRAGHRYGIPVYGSICRSHHRPLHRLETPEAMRAAAALLWDRGLYFFNHYIPREYTGLNDLTDRQRLSRLPKAYFADQRLEPARYNGTVSSGPMPLEIGSIDEGVVECAVSIRIGDDPGTAKSACMEVTWNPAPHQARVGVSLGNKLPGPVADEQLPNVVRYRHSLR